MPGAYEHHFCSPVRIAFEVSALNAKSGPYAVMARESCRDSNLPRIHLFKLEYDRIVQCRGA
jgi:hypothetical protein